MKIIGFMKSTCLFLYLASKSKKRGLYTTLVKILFTRQAFHPPVTIGFLQL